MKKALLFILIILLMPSFTFGGGLILLDSEGNDITGDTLELTGSPDDDVLKAEVFLFNDTDEEIQVYMKKIEIDILEGTTNIFCWSGSCFPPNVYESPEPLILGPDETSSDDDFYAEYFPNGMEGTTIIDYEFFCEDDSFEAVVVTVVYTTEAPNFAAFPKPNEWGLSVPAPNPAAEHTEISYQLPEGTRSAYLTISNMTGLQVAKTALDTHAGSLIINTSNLQDGVYLYSLIINNSIVSTKKLVIRK